MAPSNTIRKIRAKGNRELPVQTGSHIKGNDLEQIPDNEEEEDEDEDKDSLLKAMSIAELEQFKTTYKDNPSVCKIIDGYIEAKRRQEAQE